MDKEKLLLIIAIIMSNFLMFTCLVGMVICSLNIIK